MTLSSQIGLNGIQPCLAFYLFGQQCEKSSEAKQKFAKQPQEAHPFTSCEDFALSLNSPACLLEKNGCGDLSGVKSHNYSLSDMLMKHPGRSALDFNCFKAFNIHFT
jgi:hypothetical protein